jgi:hypothetical protein
VVSREYAAKAVCVGGGARSGSETITRMRRTEWRARRQHGVRRNLDVFVTAGSNQTVVIANQRPWTASYACS